MSASKKWNSKLPSVKEWQDKMREKIRASKLLDIALEVAEGSKVIPMGQAHMIIKLMDRVLPPQTEQTVEVYNQTVDPKELLSRLTIAAANNSMLKQMLSQIVAPIEVESVRVVHPIEVEKIEQKTIREVH